MDYNNKSKKELILELSKIQKQLERFRKLARNRYNRYCFYDKLTNLFNRAYFEEELRRLDTVRQLPLSIIMGDINGLKLVNDAFGHREGDNLLIKCGKFLKESCRKEDIISRWGGDEFTILLPRTTDQGANDLITRIQECCRNNDNYKDSIPLSLSLGASTRTDIKKDINSILKEAEENMYKNKFLTTISISNDIIDSLQTALWEKSHESREDLDRVKKMALKLGQELKLPEDELEKLSILSAIHDIGKVAILESILEKRACLSENDWKILKRHSEIGYNIAKSSNKLSPVAEAIMTHHEWWNGNGYPYNLKGEAIPIISRILAVVDAYDAMVSDRPFKKAISKAEAIEELKKLSEVQFDPNIVNFFIKVIG